ncbi:MAG: 2'-5' RNA ligase family protein [Bifidobacteriaceae bacterium]|jgi:2'-5' RNA ligase|nr:2'-5' RNA ligase family protein [Bifidobacteriaceae bacterium]
MVPPPQADRLRQIRLLSGDPQGGTAQPHITVIPPTAVDRAGLGALLDGIGRRVSQFQPFQVRLSGAGTFRPVSPVVYAKLAEGFDTCQALEAQVRLAVDGLEDRFPYCPHVTVAQDVPESGLDGAERAIDGLDETFTITAVDVCWLETESVWRPLRRFWLARSEHTNTAEASGGSWTSGLPARDQPNEEPS